MNKVNRRVNSTDQLVGKRLKLRRMQLGISQSDLAAAVNVSVQQIYKYESALNRISSGTLFEFANFLKVSTNYFFRQSNKQHSFDEQNTLTEGEVITLTQALNRIQDLQIRKDVVALISEMVLKFTNIQKSAD